MLAYRIGEELAGAVELVRPFLVEGVRDRVPFSTEEDGALHYSQNPQDKRPSRAGVEFEFGDRSPAREDQLELLRLGVEVVSLRTHQVAIVIGFHGDKLSTVAAPPC